MAKSSWEFSDQVAKGMKLLDERLGPEWVEKIVLSELDLASGCACVLGQLSIEVCSTKGSYFEAALTIFGGTDEPDGTAEDYGFYARKHDDYPALTQAWNTAIVARRRETS